MVLPQVHPDRHHSRYCRCCHRICGVSGTSSRSRNREIWCFRLSTRYPRVSFSAGGTLARLQVYDPQTQRSCHPVGMFCAVRTTEQKNNTARSGRTQHVLETGRSTLHLNICLLQMNTNICVATSSAFRTSSHPIPTHHQIPGYSVDDTLEGNCAQNTLHSHECACSSSLKAPSPSTKSPRSITPFADCSISCLSKWAGV